jgi:DNA-binding response OmpR family regulator
VTSEESRGLVLVVEDEAAIAELERLYLVREGFSVQVVRTGEDALRAVRALRPVAVILDVGLPGMDGTQVCRRMREEHDDTPVLFVTARDEEVDRVLGLELGADDYVTKPFSPRELVARVKAVLRRGRLGDGGAPLEVGRVRLHPDQRRVEVDGQDVEFTATEFDLLAHLMRQPGRVFSREELLSAVWGYGPVVTTRTVDVHVAQVRAKTGDALRIRTVRGVGYGVER